MRNDVEHYGLPRNVTGSQCTHAMHFAHCNRAHHIDLEAFRNDLSVYSQLQIRSVCIGAVRYALPVKSDNARQRFACPRDTHSQTVHLYETHEQIYENTGRFLSVYLIIVNASHAHP